VSLDPAAARQRGLGVGHWPPVVSGLRRRTGWRGRGDILGADLMTHDLTPSTLAGVDDELVSAPRLDNQATCYAGLEAFLAAETREMHLPGAVPVRHEPRVAGGLVVQPGALTSSSSTPASVDGVRVMGHQVRAEDVGRVHASPFGDVGQKRPGASANAPDRVDVPLRITDTELAVLGQVDRQLRDAQDRLVDAHQPVVDVSPTVSTADTDAEVASSHEFSQAPP